MRLIDGRAIAADIGAEVSAAAAALTGAGTTPTLAVLVPTDDEATAWYVRSIERVSAKVGVACYLKADGSISSFISDGTASRVELLGLVSELQHVIAAQKD